LALHNPHRASSPVIILGTAWAHERQPKRIESYSSK
jgi:hypothetical protein